MFLTTTVIVRAAWIYRPFPSGDDFVYLPLAWASHDPGLYPRDTLLRNLVHHTPPWNILVASLDRSIGDPLVFWLLGFLLALATVGGLARLARSSGVSLFLLPLAAALAFCGPVIGFGRAPQDGGWVEGFHPQWLALCALLWSYDALVRNRMAWAGALLGASALSDPILAAHGVAVLATGAAVAGTQRLRRFPILVVMAALVGLPVSVSFIRWVVVDAHPVASATPEAIRLGYVFHDPLKYLPELTPASTWWYLGIMVLAGLAAALVPRTGAGQPNIRPLVGLLAGQALVTAAGALLYGDGMPERWRYALSLPYVLDLSRSSGLLLPLGAVLLVGALELRPARRDQSTPTHELLWIGLFAVTATGLLFFVTWSIPLAALVALGLIGRGLGPGTRAPTAVAAGLTAVAALGLARIHEDTRLRAELSPEEAGLYRWAAETPTNALFIVPPGLQGFRFYGRRSVFVDFKLFPPAAPSASREWRRRMMLVAAPDRLALRSQGWSGVPQWDRTYSNRNTPARVLSMLRETGADYFVWDRSGLDVPPYVPVERLAVPGLTVAFQNARFEVYAPATP